MKCGRWVFLFFFLWITPLLATSSVSAEDRFTINYTNVSIQEYLKFVSKITGVNFIYQEEDLNFSVSVLSEDPVTPENVLATLTQVLRINGLFLMEEKESLVIHKNPDVRQPAPLMLEGEKRKNTYPMATKIFRLKQAQASAVSAVVRPMISSSAILEIFESTNQLILTDITATVEKVSSLIENLDSSQTPLSIEPFHAKYEEVGVLMDLGTKILEPITKGSPFLLVPQTSTQVIFIVSNSPLIEKAIKVLSVLDAEAKKPKYKTLKSENVFIYKIEHRTVSEIMRSLQAIASNIQKRGYIERGLLETIDKAKPIVESNTLLFTGDPSSLNKVRELLQILDVSSKEEVESSEDSFFVYKPLYVSPSQVERALQDVAESLLKSPLKDQSLLKTLQSAKIVPSTQSVIFSGDPTTFSKVKELLASIDNAESAEGEGNHTFYVYQIQNVPEEVLAASLKKLAKTLEKEKSKNTALVEAIDSMKYLPDTNSILFTGTQRALERLKELIPSFDQGFEKGALQKSSQFLVYKPQYLSGKELQEVLGDFISNLQDAKLTDPNLLRSLQSMHWIDKTQSLIFTGDTASLQKVEGLLATVDVQNSPAVPGLKRTFLIYQLQYVPEKSVEDYLKKVSDNLTKKSLKEENLVEAIRTMRWIPEAHSFMFSGTQTALNQIKQLLTNFDIPVDKAFAASKPKFLLYPLQNVSKERLEAYLHQVSQNLNRSDIEQNSLYNTIHSMKWISESHSFMFNGNETSLAKVQELVSHFDTTTQKQAPEKSTFILYPLKYVSQKQMDAYLSSLVKNLKNSGLGEQALMEIISERKWIQDSHSYMFSGPQNVLDRLQVLLKDFDEPSDARQAQGYFLYKLENTPGDVIEEDLERFAKNMKASGMGNTKVIQVIENLKWIKETNSILLTGDASAIEEVKALIVQYDIPRKSGSVHSEFYMYKPQYVTPQQLQKSLLDIAKTLKQGGLTDSSLLSAINGMKFSSETCSVIFTGSQQTLQKIEGLIKEVDLPSSRQKKALQKSGFFLYKLKFVSGEKMLTYLKDITDDLKKSGSSDQQFLSALTSVRFVQETNSLVFTGSDPSLERVKALVEKFDIPSLTDHPKGEVPSSFFVYKPVYVSGSGLEKMLLDFADNLKEQGLYDPALYQTIRSMKWITSTKSLVFTGDKNTLAQVKDLLQLFDTPQEGQPFSDGSIQPIDNTSFLVYKLQYHKGTEIQNALRQIAKDFDNNKTQVNKELLLAIQSIQWLEVTNSLLCTGPQETLTRLKELIKNLDVPLKQVFIEVLVIQTSLANILTFGLDWTSNFKHKDKFSGKLQNSSNTTSNFLSNFDTVNATTSPAPTLIPNLQPSFELGVIGDIILHRGRSFISMGSLLRALQKDQETTIVTTPKLLTQDNKQASIFIGQNVPYAGSFVRNEGQNTVINQNLEYRDIGMNLTITPVLGNSDIVTLDIQLNSSSIATDALGNTDTNIINNQGVSGITTSKTNLNTTVHVPNESFLVLSGMVDITKTERKEGIPCLGGLPYLASAFSVASKGDTRSNIVVFIRPHIIHSYEDVKKITEEQEDAFREQTGSPRLEKEFDEAMEYIKGEEDR